MNWNAWKAWAKLEKRCLKLWRYRTARFPAGFFLRGARLWRPPAVLCSGGIVRNHFRHSVELVDREGDIVDVLAAVEDFLLAPATYEAARRRWPKERIRLSQ